MFVNTLGSHLGSQNVQFFLACVYRMTHAHIGLLFFILCKLLSVAQNMKKSGRKCFCLCLTMVKCTCIGLFVRLLGEHYVLFEIHEEERTCDSSISI